MSVSHDLSLITRGDLPGNGWYVRRSLALHMSVHWVHVFEGGFFLLYPYGSQDCLNRGAAYWKYTREE